MLKRAITVVGAAMSLAFMVSACGSSGPGTGTVAITAQPTDQSVVVGSSATFKVTATGATGYQWQRSTDNGTTFTNVSGATSASYATPATQLTDNGSRYRVIVTGANGSVTSTAATLTVTATVEPPRITVQPIAQSVTAGQNATFSVTATGTAITYQWQSSTDGGTAYSDLTGASSATLTRTAVSLSDNGKFFRVMVRNSAGTVISNGALLTVTESTLSTFRYFVADNGINGQELWKTDGTAVGTVMVRDINAGGTGSSFISGLTDFNGATYFTATDGTEHGAELWKTDGTTAGTVMVKDIYPGTNNGVPQQFTLFKGALYFQAEDNVSGRELWKTDGTTAGTVLVKDIASGINHSTPSGFAVLQDTLYFGATDFVKGAELWRSDGTGAGTVMVKDIVAGAGSSAPSQFTVLNNAIVFSAIDANAIRNLWITNGTESGTARLKVLTPGPSDDPRRKIFNGALYFVASGEVTAGVFSGLELWRTDGTELGTAIVKDIIPDANGSDPNQFTLFNNALYFVANDSTGRELWKTDGTAAGTVLVKEIAASGSSEASNLILFNGALYFSATDRINGIELWKSDGTAAGTAMLKDINPGAVSSDPANFVVHNGALEFSASDPTNGNELWKTDGTASGTAMIKDIYLGTNGSM